MIHKALAIMGIALVCCTAASAQNKTLKGNGVYKTIEVKKSDFSRLILNVDAALEVHQSTDSAGMIELYAEENVIYQLDVEQKNDKIEVNFLSPFLKMEYGTIRIKVYSSKLNHVEINGSGIIRMNYPIIEKEFTSIVSGNGQFIGQTVNCSKLTCSVIGSGDIAYTGGAAEKANYLVTGSGEIRNQHVEVKQLKVNTNSSGNINCHAVESLNSTIIGSGTVRYKGEPSMKTKTVGSGLLTPYKE